MRVLVVGVAEIAPMATCTVTETVAVPVAAVATLAVATAVAAERVVATRVWDAAAAALVGVEAKAAAATAREAAKVAEDVAVTLVAVVKGKRCRIWLHSCICRNR